MFLFSRECKRLLVVGYCYLHDMRVFNVTPYHKEGKKQTNKKTNDIKCSIFFLVHSAVKVHFTENNILEHVHDKQ